MAILQNKTPCIEGKGWQSEGGYYVKQINNKKWLYHRLVWTEHYGDIPKGMLIRHLCHNPGCCNIEHLAIGTYKDNRKDDRDVGKSWALKGEDSLLSKLTEKQVLEIRSLKLPYRHPKGYNGDICDKYNITPTTLRDIWKRVTWAHL